MGKLAENKYGQLNMDQIYELVIREHKKYIAKLPANIDKDFDIDELKTKGNTCYRMRPKKNFNGTYIIYLYGSLHCRNILQEQWNLVVKLSKETGCGLYVPIYPLAPENSCRDTFNMLEKAYSDFVIGHDVEKVILLGDSTGAGLALSLALRAWKEGFRKPDQLIMLSPYLDSEYFDKKLEQQVLEAAKKEKDYFFNETIKEFINTYWVKDYAVKTEFTSPYYEDFTDLCDDVVIFSGSRDMYNCYAHAFYNNAKQQGLNIRFFEFEDEYHEFMIHSDSKEAQRAYGYLKDVVAKSFDESLTEIYQVKLVSDWSKKYPDMIRDEWASKFIYSHKFDFKKLPVKLSQKSRTILAASCIACDEKVRKYIMEYPNCTIINLGCRLDNMFQRMDNGRIQWYNIDDHNTMSVRRSMYGERSREKTIGRRLMDFSWLEEIQCDRNRGVMVVCNDTLSYLKKNEFKKLIDKLEMYFPGCEIVFTTMTLGTKLLTNRNYMKRTLTQRKIKLHIDDAQILFGSWRSDCYVLSEEPIMKYFNEHKGLGLSTALTIWYNLMTYNYKIVHVKLGSEEYNINMF
ncbi:MAG: alpha/beta hydrolase fold domain-containing protein [Wujia sp.]